jgi:hypothetical protein
MKIFSAFISLIVVLSLCAVVLTGCGGSNNSAAPAVAPTAPTAVTIAPGNARATLTWASVVGASSYNIYWSTTPGVTAATGTKITGATNPYTLAQLTNGTTYYFVVSAVNEHGESAASDQCSTVPTTSNISVIQTGDNVFTLQASNFVAPAGFHLIVSYDSSRFANPRVVQGSLVDGAMFATNTTAPAEVQIAVVSGSAMQGSGPIAIITFDQIGNSPGGITVQGSVINIAGKNLPVSFSGWSPSGTI